MSADPRFDHDVFISYASVDNPSSHSWITHFVSNLTELLAIEYGFNNDDRIWWDQLHFDKDTSLTEQISRRVRRSACMVVVLSAGYVHSDWCRQEREAFLAAMAESPDQVGRIFLIDLGQLELSARPPDFQHLRGHHFFRQKPGTSGTAHREQFGFPVPVPKNPDHKEFYSATLELAKGIHGRVSKLRTASKPGATAAPKPTEKLPEKRHKDITIFVAEATDDAATEREDVVRFLSDHFTVVPSNDDALPNSWDEWKSTVDQQLSTAKLVVQVLGAFPGKPIRGSKEPLILAQYDRAILSGKPIMSWRLTGPDSVPDPRLKQLVAAAAYCGTIAEFNQEVKQKAIPVQRPQPPSMPFHEILDAPKVFIQTDINDLAAASQLMNRLCNSGCTSFLPLTTGTPSEIREDTEQHLTTCDGLIVYYGESPPAWVRSQFSRLDRYHALRRETNPTRPMKAWAICQGPPPSKAPLNFGARNLLWIDLNDDTHEEQLSEWVARLRSGGV